MVLAGKLVDEGFVLIGFGAAELVVEVDNGKHQADFGADFEKKAKKCYRIRASRNGDPRTVASLEQFEPADVLEEFVCERMHGNMVQPVRLRTENLAGPCPVAQTRASRPTWFAEKEESGLNLPTTPGSCPRSAC